MLAFSEFMPKEQECITPQDVLVILHQDMEPPEKSRALCLSLQRNSSFIPRSHSLGSCPASREKGLCSIRQKSINSISSILPEQWFIQCQKDTRDGNICLTSLEPKLISVQLNHIPVSLLIVCICTWPKHVQLVLFWGICKFIEVLYWILRDEFRSVGTLCEQERN